MKTLVVFRRWPDKEGGDVFAMFPEEPADRLGTYCMSYQHLGQHGAADYHGCIGRTFAASPEEYASLKRELEGIGYDLKVVERVSVAVHHKRRNSMAGL